MYSNSEILSAVLAKWAQPLMSSIVDKRLCTLPALANIEAKIKSTGWVSQRWNMVEELTPILSKMSGNLVTPILSRYISKLNDEDIPAFAHEIVDSAIANEGISLFDGNLIFTKEDMVELKRYLDCNLPLKQKNGYTVKENL